MPRSGLFSDRGQSNQGRGYAELISHRDRLWLGKCKASAMYPKTELVSGTQGRRRQWTASPLSGRKSAQLSRLRGDCL